MLPVSTSRLLIKPCSLLLFSIGLLCSGMCAENQQFANIGDLKLESGEVIRDCIVGYRAFGEINAQKNNVVVFPTFLGGRSADLEGRIGPGKLVDSTRYYVIAVDSLADGISSSPSNSKAQPGARFPKISIRDMVNAEHAMLTDALHLTHVRAVMGFSMGGMQALQWGVSFPGFMDSIISIVGSPQLTSWDMLVWRTELLAANSDLDWNHGQYTKPPKLHLMDSVHALVLTSPEYVANNTPIHDFDKFLAEQIEDGSFDANDNVWQIGAILTQDIAATVGGSLQRAAEAIKVPMLIVVNRQDHLANPLTSIQLATLSKARLLVLDSNCGHRAHRCEQARIGEAVADFLQK